MPTPTVPSTATEARPTRPRFLVDLWEHHLDELGFLFGLWRAALTDPDHTIESVGEMEERVRGHLQGVQVPGADALPLLIEALEGDDDDLLFPAAYALLHAGDEELAAKVVAAFERAEDDALEALGLALAYGPLTAALGRRIRDLLGGEDRSRAIAAAEALAQHGALKLSGEQLRFFLEDEDADVRARAWRVAGLVGASVPARAYSGALRDEEPAVSDAALEAGAWCGETGVLAALRDLAAEPSPERLRSLRLLAVLGAPTDLPLLESVITVEDLGPERFRLASAWGHPRIVDWLVEQLAHEDAATAAAAGAAFRKVTGVDVESDTTATLPPEEDGEPNVDGEPAEDGDEPDDIEAEFLEEVMLPDVDRARAEWARLRPGMAGANRVCAGVDAERPMDPAVLSQLDMESRRDLYLRSRFAGSWQGTAAQLEVFPQAATPR